MFKNLTIKSRLIFMISFLSLLLISGGVIGIASLGFTNDVLRANYEKRLVPVTQLDKIIRLMNSNQLSIAESLSSVPELVGPEMDAVEKRAAELGQIWDQYMATGLGDEEMELANRFIASRAKFVAEGLKPAVKALRGEDPATAKEIMVGQMKPLFKSASDSMNALMQWQVEHAKKEFESSQVIYDWVRISCASGIAFGVILAAMLGVWLIRAVSHPLNRAVDVARSVAHGDLTQDIVIEANDETGQLMTALKGMNENLVSMVENVREGTDTIASASSQIASRNLDLSARTEQQASSLQETAASMEQLTSTVKQNADNAQQANQLALTASDVALKGGVVVAQVVSTMGSINESSMKIVDIIGVIDSIAFQTNILALNAAVEAARAGEQGRGFAVVAGEVRHLAQRSAAAAKEIKDLIGDSVEKVESGKKLVDQAGATMAEIVERVRRVTDIMSEISIASQEQTAGIEQVNQAISLMDEATQHNAAQVEEAAAVAEALRDQALTLAHAVSVFKLHADHASAVRAESPNVTPIQRPPARKPGAPARLAAPADPARAQG